MIIVTLNMHLLQQDLDFLLSPFELFIFIAI